MFIFMLVYTWLLTSDMYLNISQNIANLNVIFNTLLTLSLKFIIVTMKTSSTFGDCSMVSKGTIYSVQIISFQRLESGNAFIIVPYWLLWDSEGTHKYYCCFSWHSTKTCKHRLLNWLDSEPIGFLGSYLLVKYWMFSGLSSVLSWSMFNVMTF